LNISLNIAGICIAENHGYIKNKITEIKPAIKKIFGVYRRYEKQ